MPRPWRPTNNPLARALREWWVKEGRKRFGTMKRLAQPVGVSPDRLSLWFNGSVSCPRPGERKRLYKVTGLDCLRSPRWARGHQLKGTSRWSSGAPFAAALDGYWSTQTQFSSKREMAQALGMRPNVLIGYMSGRHFPEPKWCESLYKLTGLECFGPGADSARRLHHLLQKSRTPWARDILVRAFSYIDSTYGSRHTRKGYYTFVSQFVTQALKTGIKRQEALRPGELVRFHLAKTSTKDRAALGFVGQFFLEAGYWGPPEKQKFKKLLRESFEPTQRQRTRSRSSPAFAALVKELALRGGLHSKEIRHLRRSQIKPDGIDLGPSRFIPFGSGPHTVTHQLVGDWIEQAKPRDFIFYQRRPQNHHKPMGSTKLGLPALREAHFQEDLRNATHLRKLRLHFQGFHALSPAYSYRLIRQFVEGLDYFFVPAPYLLAVLAACRLLRCEPQALRGGERSTAQWSGLLGRNDVEVNWPIGFARELAGRGHGVACLLMRLAKEFWCGRWRLNKDVPLERRALRLLSGLALTRVEVRDVEQHATWGGSLLEARCRNRYFAIPLIEAMEGGVVDGRCLVCRHPQRLAIDQELQKVMARDSHIKGFSSIAKKYGLPYPSLLVHAGTKKTGTRYYDRLLRSHVGSGVVAPLVRFPIVFTKIAYGYSRTAIALFLFLLAESSQVTVPDVTLSLGSIKQGIGLELRESELLQNLNQLRLDGLFGPMTRRYDGFAVRPLFGTN
jgi:hypothetical protein